MQGERVAGGVSAKNGGLNVNSTIFACILVIKYSVADKTRRVRNGAQGHGTKNCDYKR